MLPLTIELSFSGPEGLRLTRMLRNHAGRLEREALGRERQSRAPLPLGTAWWLSHARGAGPESLVWAILTNRELASLYYALGTMDDATVAEIAANPAVASVLLRHATVLPSHARGIRIAAGRIVPAGGDRFAPAWESLVGATLDDPASFIDRLCRRDGGRFLHFFKTIGALNPAQLLFVAGEETAGPRATRARLAQLSAAFVAAQPNDEGQSLLPADGVASVLFSLVVLPDGRLAGPSSREFWSLAWEGDWRIPEGEKAEELASAAPLTPAQIITWLCPAGGCDQQRVETFLFVQRRFPTATIAESASVLPAAWTRRRFPALALEIERMSLDDPVVYAELGRVARKLDTLGGTTRASSTIQFQAGVALLARMRAVGAPRELVRGWVRELGALPLKSSGYQGALVEWVFTRVLTTRDGEDADAAAVRHLSGSDYRGPGEPVDWEGLHYRVDLAATEADRLRMARARFSGSSFELARTLARGLVPSDARRPTGDDDQRGQIHWTGSAHPLPVIGAGSANEQLASADLLAADAFVLLLYALALEDPVNSVMASRELPRRHILFGVDERRREISPWVHATESRGARGRVIAGALLGLDASVASLSARRLSMTRPIEPSHLAPEIAAGLQRSAAVTTVWTADLLSRDPGSGVSLSPCVCLRPWSDRWRRLGLRFEPSASVEWVHEPLDRVLQELSRRKMPVVLVPGVLRLLISDVVENALVAHPNDIHGVLEYVRTIPSDRFEDFIAAVAARGPLMAESRQPMDPR